MAKGTLHLNVEFSAVADEEGKFARLAKLLGLADADHALGRCTHLWVACTRRGEAELPQWLVEQTLGERGPEALIESGLASWSRGRGDTKARRLRIGGAQKHCLWMVSDQVAERDKRRKGGETRAKTSSRQLDGKFAPAGDMHPAEHPAQSSSSEISSEITTEPERETLSRAIPPSTTPSTAPPPAPLAVLGPVSEPIDLVKAKARGQLAESFWGRISAARVAEAARLGLTGVLPLPALNPSSQPRSFDELRQRIREEGDGAATVCEHVLTVLVEQARERKSIEWLSEKAFLEGSWRTSRESIPGSPRASPGARDGDPKTTGIRSIPRLQE